MDYNFLFHHKFPPGVKTVFVNGKRITRKEFLKRQENYLNKNESKNTY